MNIQLQEMLQEAVHAFQKGNLDGANLILKQVLQIDSNNLPALNILGLIKATQSHYKEAADYLSRAAQFDPNDASIQYNLAKVLSDSGNDNEALIHYKNAVTLASDNPDAWLNYGKSASNLGRHSEALLCYANSLNLKPDYAEALLNKGATLKEINRFEEAIACTERALSINPNLIEAWSNKGVALKELKRFDEAIIHYDKALALKPDYAEAGFNKSYCLLLQGNFENGLRYYECRWNSKKISEIAGMRIFDKPTWLGVESLQDKTILLYGEQGLGDYIQFCRYVKLVADLGAKVILEVPQSLASLMQGLQAVSEFVIKGNSLPFFDYQCPLLSLPLAFRTTLATIPWKDPYLYADKNKALEWKHKLGEKRKKRVGIAWSSTSNFKNDAKRSLLLADFVKALALDRYEYVCLQKELKECDVELFKAHKNIRFYGDAIRDFSDTAALIENVDIVISTCTSIPHLSGAMGKSTWILLSNVPDWRWLMDRKDSPWYPSVRLYRQPVIGDWYSVFDKVKLDLKNSFG